MKTSLMMILLLAGCGNGRSSTPNEQSLSDMSDLSIWGDGMQGFGAASGGGDGDDTAGDRDADRSRTQRREHGLLLNPDPVAAKKPNLSVRNASYALEHTRLQHCSAGDPRERR